jgi:hypothetical protein
MAFDKAECKFSELQGVEEKIVAITVTIVQYGVGASQW